MDQFLRNEHSAAKQTQTFLLLAAESWLRGGVSEMKCWLWTNPPDLLAKQLQLAILFI